MAPEFFTLSGPSKPQPGPAKRNDGPPQGPPRGPPQGPPQGPPHGPPQGHPNGPPQGHPIVPPPPPRIMIPVDLRGGPAIQISDVSQDLLSESDMRGELTDYMVFRFEKMADKDGFDDDGRPKWPSWEKAIRTEDRSIPKQVAAEKIRQLNRNSKSVIDKKSSLTAPLKRQIDSTLEFLMSREPDLVNYQWVLAQVDHQLKPLDPYFSNGFNQQYLPTRGHRSSTHHSSAKRRPHSRSGSRHHIRKAYERVSLTAYFKRVPRLGVDIFRLWNEKRMGLEGIYRDFHPLQPNHNQFQQGPPPQQMPQQNPSGAHQHNGQGNQQKAQQGNQQQPQKGNQQQPQRGNQQQPQKGNKQARHGGSDSDSGSESCSSSCSSSSGSPPTSVSERQGRGHHKDHNHVRVPGNHPHPHVPRHEGPRGYRPSGSPRLQRVSVSPHHSPRAPGPPHPPTREGSVASHIERVRDDAYQRGRMAGMSDARLVEELAQSKIHARPRPRIIQEQSPPRLLRVRTDMDDIPRQFTRLSVYDDDLGDVGLRREDTRRRREFEYRAQRGSILDEDPFESPPSPSSYTTYSTDGRRRGPQIIEIPERYPRSPGPRRARDFY